MRPIGFSTGALAHADFERARGMLRGTGIEVVELSALREAELAPLVSAIEKLDFSQFRYVSVHAPSLFPREKEAGVIDALRAVAKKGWPIVLHPDAIHEHALWRSLGEAVCLENMDRRKPIGRSAKELSRLFDLLPKACFCFDIGHPRQFDSTMTEAYLLLTTIRGRLRQVHVSEVTTSSKHDLLPYASILAFREVAHLIPEETPLILETPASRDGMRAEMERVREALPVGAAA